MTSGLIYYTLLNYGNVFDWNGGRRRRRRRGANDTSVSQKLMHVRAAYSANMSMLSLMLLSETNKGPDLFNINDYKH